MKRMARWVAVVVGCGALAAMSEAGACGNSSRGHGMRHELRALFDDREEFIVPRLTLAEDALRDGNYALAANQLDAIAAAVKDAPARLRFRFDRVSGLVSVRTGGQWPLAKAGTENSAPARQRALEDAARRLRLRAVAIPADPIRQTDLAEALAALPKFHKEAKRILEGLASRDLVTSAHGYAALARLRAQSKDASGAEAALNACRKIDEKRLACPVQDTPKA